MRASLVPLSCILLIVGAFGGDAGAQAPNLVSFPAKANGQITFVMPSQNVECTYTPQGGTAIYKPFDGGPELSCDRAAPQYVRVVLTPKAVRRFNDVGDQDCCGVENVLAYGSSWSEGPFICDSAESGLTCKGPDGHRFFVSRAKIEAH